MRQPDGSVALLDLGSMNGTRLNGMPVEANVLTSLTETDQITLGCWTPPHAARALSQGGISCR